MLAETIDLKFGFPLATIVADHNYLQHRVILL